MFHNKFNYNAENYNNLFNNKQFILELVKSIRLKLGRNLTHGEKNFLINFLKKIDGSIFNNKSLSNILMVLTDYISEQLSKMNCGKDNDGVDIHEMLKSEIGGLSQDSDNLLQNFTQGGSITNTAIDNTISNEIVNNFSNQVEVTSLLGNTSLTDLQKLINPDLVRKYFYVMMDTRYRILDKDGIVDFSWNFINNENVTQGTVNATGNIRDIVGMRVYPIRMPYNDEADNEYNRVTMFIKEFSGQSFIAQENRRFHFIFDVIVTDRWMELCPFNFNDGYYRFDKPITQLDKLTISFGAPLSTISFDEDRLNTSVGGITYGADTEFTTIDSHNLETGDRVYITNFTTANPPSNSVLINTINSSDGLIATYIDDNTFSIDTDTTSLRVLGTGTLSLTNGSPTVTGTGTSFLTFFNVNDVIEILSVNYVIATIPSATSLTLSSNYAGATAAGVAYYINNRVSNLVVNVYFGSKRIFIPIEFEYLSPGDEDATS